MEYRTYASPFSWRYGRAELRSLFSEEERRKLWRAVWVALAQAQAREGLVSPAEVADLRAHAARDRHRGGARDRARDSPRLDGRNPRLRLAGKDRRRETAPGRDLDGYRGYGRDLSLAPRARRGRREPARAACKALPRKVRQYADLVCMAFTHLQPAEPTTLGYRLAVYAQDLLIDDTNLRFVFEKLTTKGLRGAVGTAASYEHLLDHRGASAALEDVRARAVRLAGARDQHANLSAQTRLPAALRACRPGRLAFEVCRRRAHFEQPGVRRSRRAFRSRAGRQLGDAVQAQSDPERTHRLARAPARRPTPTSRGRTPRRTISSARSTTAPTAARFFPKRCSAPTRSSRSRAR